MTKPQNATRLTTLLTAAALSLMALPALADTITGDLTVRDDLCVGRDCADGGVENFSTEDFKIKDTSPDMVFEDTSPSNFATYDWRIRINDTFAGFFAIQDVDSASVPFRLDAFSPDNALRVISSGDVGLGTGIPQADLHISRSSTPTLRLEQTAAGGEPAATWDIASNDRAFFVREGTILPFQIKAGAPYDSLVIAEGGNIGLGTDFPDAKLHVQGQSMLIKDAGRVNFTLSDTSDAGPDFRTQLSSGSARFSFVGTGKIEMELEQNGDLKIAGNYLSSGTQLNVPDYVFAEDYALRPLAEVQSFIDTHSHLPEVPSAAQIATEGLDMSEMQMTLLKKIEELTLYTLEQEETIARLEARQAETETLRQALEALRAEVAELKAPKN